MKRLHTLPHPLTLSLALALLGAVSAPAQTKTDYFPDLIEIAPFGGATFYKRDVNGLETQHVKGGAVGIRVVENLWKYVGVEESFTYATNNLTFKRPTLSGDIAPAFGVRTKSFAVNPLFYLMPRGARIRPFVTLGLGAIQFDPTDDAMRAAQSPALSRLKASTLNDNLQVQFNYGAGVLVHLMKHVGLRFDARGLLSRNPTYVLSNGENGGVYIPNRQKLNGLQTTAGLVFSFGGAKDEVVVQPKTPAAKAVPVVEPAPAVAPKPEALAAIGAVMVRVTNGFYRPQGRTADGILCMDLPVTLTAEAVDPAGKTLKYKWTRDGQVVQDTESATYMFTPAAKGDTRFDVEAYDAASGRSSKGGLTLTIYEYRKPTISAISGPATAKFGETVSLNATGTASECSAITYRWTVSEGTIAGSGTSATYDTKLSGITASGRAQNRTIRVNAQVADDRGASADAAKDLRVDYTPAAVRFDDLIFSKGNARVNNCAKRILLEELAGKAADGDYRVVLVGHVDTDEKGLAGLDKRRAMNAAAVLTGGTGTCAKVDATRVKIDWVGTDQTAEKRPALCGTSARGESKERRGSAVTDADASRRVEVWLVPVTGGLPGSVKSLKDLNAAEMKRLGCPQ